MPHLGCHFTSCVVPSVPLARCLSPGMLARKKTCNCVPEVHGSCRALLFNACSVRVLPVERPGVRCHKEHVERILRVDFGSDPPTPPPF